MSASPSLEPTFGPPQARSADLSAIIIGALFVVLALLGSVRNPIVSPNGVFTVNVAHSFIHLASGFVLVVASYLGEAVGAITGLGLVYLSFSIAGLVLPEAARNYLA